MNNIQKIRELIKIGDVPEAIDLIFEWSNQENIDEIILHSSRFNEVNKLLREGILSFSNAAIEKNKIVKAILEILREIEKKGIQPATPVLQNDLPPLPKTTLRFVSDSVDKYNEYAALLHPLSVRHSRLEIEELQIRNLETLVEKKIKFVAPIFEDIPFFIEHTELVIHAWNGLPGGMTDQFLDTVGCAGICKMLTSFTRKERFATARTMIGLNTQQQGIKIFEGTINGQISEAPRPGQYDFGWDSIFIPDGYTATYSELGIDIKNSISMRTIAALKMKDYLERNA